MSTLQDTPRHRNRIRTRLTAGVIAAGALIAIAVSILFLSLTSAHRTPTSTTNSADPATAPASILAPTSTGVFRDPTTHALLRIRAVPCDAWAFRAEQSCRTAP
jgi:hypothetical protein